jgi:hypothetical protein
MPMVMPLTGPAWRGQQSTQQMSTESEAKHAQQPTRRRHSQLWKQSEWVCVNSACFETSADDAQWSQRCDWWCNCKCSRRCPPHTHNLAPSCLSSWSHFVRRVCQQVSVAIGIALRCNAFCTFDITRRDSAHADASASARSLCVESRKTSGVGACKWGFRAHT